MRTGTLLIALAVPAPAASEPLAPSNPLPLPPQAALAAQEVEHAVSPALYQSMSWREIGPFRGGRSVAVTGVPSDPTTYYMGTVGGGIWKTGDAGITWTNVTDGQLGTSSVGALAVAESDPNVVYAGMGEHAVRGVMTSHGDGLYRSTDAGRTWTHLGLEATRHISRIRVHPHDPDLVYVAAQGAAYGANPERGVYRSTDGGGTWELVLFVSDEAGASDLSMDMTNPRILYAAFWDHRRYPWQVRSGGPGSGLWKSTDAGDTWNRIDEALPRPLGKTAIDVSRADPDRVFALVEADPDGGLYRSDDAGETWSRVSDNWSARARAWYYIEVYADPVDRETVYVMNAPFMRSIDGGRSFANVSVPHGDQHDLWINPVDNANMINANDGGANVTFNTGASWSTQRNQPTAQFYRVAVDHRFPYHVYGGQQDNSTVAIASRGRGGITWKDWYAVGGCESAFTAFDPADPRLVYAGCYMGIISEYDHRTGGSRDIGVYPVLPAALQGREMRYRYNWNAPIAASPHDPSTIYHAANHLVRTRDRGMTWEEVSPDLTRDDDARQGYGGAPITNEGAGGEIYGTISYVAESALEAGLIWTGSDDGLVHITRDNGASWTNVTPDGMEEGLVNAIEPSPHDPAVAYVAFTRYKFNDFAPRVFVTDDYGESWNERTEGVAEEAWVRVVREDPIRPDLLYLGTELGLYVSWDAGRRWQPFQLDMPVTPITDLAIQIRENDLVASTSGRGFWILDDLSPVQQLPDHEIRGEDFDEIALLAPRHAYRIAGGGGGFGGSGNVGRNPPTGAIIDVVLPDGVAETDTLTLEFLTESGELVRTLSSHPDPELSPEASPLPFKSGHNRYSWDLRHERIPNIPEAYVFGSIAGRRVVPGTYLARARLGDWSDEQRLEVLADPRSDATIAEYREQDAFVAEVAAELTQVHFAATDVNDVRAQIEKVVELIDGRPGADEAEPLADSLAADLGAAADSLYQARVVDGQTVINFPSRLKFQYVWLHGNAESADAGVSRGSRDVLTDLRVRWGAHRARVEELLGERLDELNETLARYALGTVLRPRLRERPVS